MNFRDQARANATLCRAWNIRETKDDVRLAFDLPGMEKKDIKVTVKENVLTVSGERKRWRTRTRSLFAMKSSPGRSTGRSRFGDDRHEQDSADYRKRHAGSDAAKRSGQAKEIEVSVG